MSLAFLVLRIALGVIMFAHGAQKMLGWFGGPGPQGFIGWMSSMGVPAFVAWLAIVAEFFGGIAVLFGVLARLGALGFVVNMVVAIVLVHAKAGFFNSGPDGSSGIEFPLILLAAALAIVIAGPGAYAVAPDLESRWLGRRMARPTPRHA